MSFGDYRSRHPYTSRRGGNNEMEALVFVILTIVSIVLAFFTAYYLWNANENENWLTAIRLAIVNTVGVGSSIFFTGVHWVVGVLSAVAFATFFIAVW